MEFELELRHAAQVIQRVEASIAAFELPQSGVQEGRAEQGREILGHSFLTDKSHSEASLSQASAPTAARDEQKYATTAFLMGAVLLLVGLSFLALAVFDARPDWWQPGLPLAILGQAALTVGVALRLDWFGRSRR